MQQRAAITQVIPSRRGYQDRGRQATVRSVMQVSDELAAKVIAEGIETRAEWETLQFIKPR